MPEGGRLRGALRFTIAILVPALLLPITAPQAEEVGKSIILASDTPPALAAIIAKYRESIRNSMAKQHVPGLAIALVFDGKLVWAEGFGVTDGPASLPVTPDTAFSVQSISKTFTATAIMRAVSEGRLSLDAPLTAYLPSFTVRSRFEQHPEAKITLRLLLAHRAGFTHEAPRGSNFERSASFAEHIASIGETWLRFPVGQRYAYSNLGVDLAGHVLEVAYRRPFADVMAEALFEPLGLRDTTVDVAAIRANASKAIGHASGYEQVPVGMAMVPAGGIYASVTDLARFMAYHLGRGKVGPKGLIDRKVLDAMYEPCCAGQRSFYGLGIMSTDSRFGRIDIATFGHSGGGDGFLSDMYWYGELGLGIAVLTNSDGHDLQLRLPAGIAQDIFASFLGRRAAPDAARPASRGASIKVDPARVRQLAGVYLGRRDIVFAARDSGLCWKTATACDPVVFRAIDEIEVRRPTATFSCRFLQDAERDPAAAECAMDIGPMRVFEAMPYNGGPYDSPGPGKAEWNTYLGDYEIWLWGKLSDTLNLHLQNGYLYFGKYRVIAETEPGLFFLADGEALDLRGATPTYRNIALVRRR